MAVFVVLMVIFGGMLIGVIVPVNTRSSSDINRIWD